MPALGDDFDEGGDGGSGPISNAPAAIGPPTAVAPVVFTNPSASAAAPAHEDGEEGVADSQGGAGGEVEDEGGDELDCMKNEPLLKGEKDGKEAVRRRSVTFAEDRKGDRDNNGSKEDEGADRISESSSTSRRARRAAMLETDGWSESMRSVVTEERRGSIDEFADGLKDLDEKRGRAPPPMLGDLKKRSRKDVFGSGTCSTFLKSTTIVDEDLTEDIIDSLGHMPGDLRDSLLESLMDRDGMSYASNDSDE